MTEERAYANTPTDRGENTDADNGMTVREFEADNTRGEGFEDTGEETLPDMTEEDEGDFRTAASEENEGDFRTSAPEENEGEERDRDDGNTDEASADEASADEASADDNRDGNGGTDTATDYESLAESDLRELKAEFPELRNLSHVSGLSDPLRYAALRDLGLSPREAYLATSRPRKADTRAHLTSAVPKRAAAPTGGITKSEMEAARELFSDLSEAGIRRLYKRVSG